MRTWESGDPDESTEQRGVTPVLGLVLLMGIVAVGSLAILMVAGVTMDAFQTDAEIDRVQQSYVDMSQAMIDTALDSDSGTSVDLDIGGDGAVAKKDTAEMIISAQTLGGQTSTWEIEFGTIEYEHETGEHIAYEGGAVFHERGEETNLVSAPAIHYDPRTNTLNFPIIDVAEEGTIDSGSYTMQYHDNDPYEDLTVLQDEQIEVTVKSDYYLGWLDYFEQAAGSGSINEVNHDDRYIKVELGYGDLTEVFQDEASYVDDPGGNHFDDHFDEDNTSQEFLPILDDVIEDLVEDVKDDHDQDISAEGTYNLDSGEYYADEITAGHEINANPGNENVTVVVEGDVHIGDGTEYTVNESGDGFLVFYIQGETYTHEGDICVGECPEDEDEDYDSDRVRVLGTSEMGINFGPGGAHAALEGVIYAMSHEDKNWWDGTNMAGSCDGEQAVLQAGGDGIFGSIAAYSICAHSSGMSFDYDSGLADEEVDLYPPGHDPPPDLTYLNVAHYEISIQD